LKRNALLPAISTIAVAAPGGFGSGPGKVAWQLSGPWQEGRPRQGRAGTRPLSPRRTDAFIGQRGFRLSPRRRRQYNFPQVAPNLRRGLRRCAVVWRIWVGLEGGRGHGEEAFRRTGEVG
jgi:hypothetical protein